MEKTFSIKDLKENKITSTDCIVIPDWLLDSIISLCDRDVEYAGQLICYKKVVEYPFLSASGSTASVFPQKKIIFTDSVDYSTIEFHTHPKALGDFWATRFSGGDLTTFSNRVIQEGEQYQHILFTPENILTWGKQDAPDVRIGFKQTQIVIDNWRKWNIKYNCWRTITPAPKI